MQSELKWCNKLLDDLIDLKFDARGREYHGIYIIQCGVDCVLHIYFPNTSRVEGMYGLKTIHLDIDLLINSYTKVLFRLKGLMGKACRIYARKTVVSRVDKKVAEEFLDEYHVNDSVVAKYRYGLYYNGELVSLATFSGGRRMNEEKQDYRSFELVRFCNKGGYSVVGGISKLIKKFVDDFHPNDIMTYCDRDWSEESSLSKIGFQIIGYVPEKTYMILSGKRCLYQNSNEKYDYLVKNRGSIKLKLYL